jgi:hypothetical protein
MKKYLSVFFFSLVMGGCTKEIEPSQDLYGEYEGRSDDINVIPIPPGTGNCYGGGLKIDDKGNNEVYIFAGCNNKNPDILPKFDNLRIGKSQVDSIRVPDAGRSPFLRKDVIYGLFNKSTGKQVAYIAYERIVTAPSPPRRIIQTYYLYIPSIISSNTKDTLTHYFGRRMLKEINE